MKSRMLYSLLYLVCYFFFLLGFLDKDRLDCLSKGQLNNENMDQCRLCLDEMYNLFNYVFICKIFIYL